MGGWRAGQLSMTLIPPPLDPRPQGGEDEAQVLEVGQGVAINTPLLIVAFLHRHGSCPSGGPVFATLACSSPQQPMNNVCYPENSDGTL